MTLKYKFLFFLSLFGSLISSIPAQTKYNCRMLVNEPVFENPPFAQCHAATIAETEDGNLIAAWFGGPFESSPDVCIWTSVNKNGKWELPKEIAKGILCDTLRYACWNPVLFNSGNNELILYYKTGPSPREWRGMKIHSFDQGKNWSRPAPLPEGILGPIKNKPLALSSGVWLNPSSTETMKKWKAFIERSSDQGKTWRKIPVDTANSAKVIQPSLLLYPGGKIQALCRSNQNYIMQSWSYDEGVSWSPLTKTSVLNPNSGIDAADLKSGIKILIYNPMESGSDWMIGRNKLNAAVSRDGITWEDICELEDEEKGEFSYPAVIQTHDGLVHILYTSNRQTIRHIVLEIQE